MSDWDKPAIARTIEAYWENEPVEVGRRAWLATVVIRHEGERP